MSVLVLGATGKLGRLLLPEIQKRGLAAADITAAGRRKDVLDTLAINGYGTVQVELGDTEQVHRAIAGHDRVVLISGIEPDRLQQHQNVIGAAKAAGVRHLYYTSGLRIDDPTFALGADHKATEDDLKASGLTFTILRNGWYIENYIQAMQGAASNGVFLAAAGDGRIAPAGRRDFAEALATVITGDGHDNRTYDLSGDRDYTYVDLAAAMTEVLGTPITYQSVSGEQYSTVLTQAGLDEGTAGFLAALDGNLGAGIMARTGDGLSRLIGHPTMSLVEGLRQV
ncbi:SDR family oxidoreductase [Actinoplanes couchii]|uniref:NAD(P)-dependent oxidoreductase n=1 Tax=Actinoplanes couchii TaxID=403638 RepID=A0ABQ3XRU8_9ACTN|nr:SDR family oxidoreductase [Actinoplanes couchii]MDR6318479.1 NAD(P)H dehydrogenase (quinone) [Actinoplanes couchii]GID61236.1 NAD(P)-dependent oxidoreductase [Actinoplanes couchii]